MSRLLLLLWFAIFVEGSGKSFRYERFHESDTTPPVYVEELENIKIFSRTWKIVIPFDISLHEDQHHQLQSVVQNLSTICTSIDSNIQSLYALRNGCTERTKKLGSIVTGMKNTWEQMMLPNIPRSTFTEEPRSFENYTTFIDENTKSFANTMTELNIDTEDIQRQLLLIDTLLDRRVSMKELKLHITNIKISIHDLLSDITILILDRKMNQRIIYDVLASGKVLPPDTLLRELQKIRESISQSKLELPLDIDHQRTTSFYDVASTQTMVIGKKIFTIHTLPIVDPAEFTLYEFHAYPSKIKGSMFQLMLPEVQRIALNMHTKKYFPVDENDLAKCKRYREATLLCKAMQPIISTEKSDSCAVDLLTKTVLPVECNYRIMNVDHEMWFRLHKTNSWLFVFPRSEAVTINCNGEIDTRFVNGAGTLTIHPKCIITTEHVHIVPSEADISLTNRNAEVAAHMEINWTEIRDTASNVSEKLSKRLVPRVIYNKESHILHEASISVKEIIVDTSSDTETTSKNNVPIFLIFLAFLAFSLIFYASFILYKIFQIRKLR